MKKLTGILIISIIAFSCKSEQNRVKSDLELANLKSNVWKIDKTLHDANGGCVCPAATKTECNQSKYIYNKNGNIIESNTIDEDGNVSVNSKYVYNKRGMCTEIDKYSGEKLVGKEVPVILDGKLVGYKMYNEKGDIETTCEYIYSGEEISVEKTLNNNGEVISQTLNEYQNGQLLLQTEKDGKGDIKTKTRFIRNSSNDIIEYYTTVSNENNEFKIKFEYEYDNAGNWTKRTQYYNGQIATIVLRNIEYFNV